MIKGSFLYIQNHKKQSLTKDDCLIAVWSRTRGHQMLEKQDWHFSANLRNQTTRSSILPVFRGMWFWDINDLMPAKQKKDTEMSCFKDTHIYIISIKMEVDTMIMKNCSWGIIMGTSEKNSTTHPITGRHISTDSSRN